MSAHNSVTLEYARRRTEYVIERLVNNDAAQAWADKLRHLTEVGTTAGSLRQWMQVHAGADVETLQVTLNLSGADAVGIRRAWAPGPRTVNASRASYVTLNGSQRGYAGAITYLSEPTIGWVGFTTDGLDDGHEISLICYYAA